MAVKNRGELCGDWIEVESAEVVEEVEVASFEEQDISFRQTAARACAIDVASDRMNRRDLQPGI